MIHSMTAFARKEIQDEWGALVWELRSVNHRYLEISSRLPDTLRELELPMRELARKYLKRGKLECTLRYQPSGNAQLAINTNLPLAEEIIKAEQALTTLVTHTSPINIMDILKWPGVMQVAEVAMDAVKDAALTSFEAALKELVDVRQREGKELKALVEERLQAIHAIVQTVKQRLPEVIESQRQKLLARFAQAEIELEPERLEQEMVFYAQKLDVDEEMDRLETHVKEVQRVLKQKDAVGRRLDFLMQELNREANTMASKSADTVTTQASVDLKVLIEQMREQIQNIE